MKRPRTASMPVCCQGEPGQSPAHRRELEELQLQFAALQLQMSQVQADYVTCRSQQKTNELKQQSYEGKLKAFEAKQVASDEAYRRLSPLIGKYFPVH